ncbi:hypothetical protein RB614_35160 [Phytohabitans sp. ZYX-F-186]|uniref:Uncharacterized protein n=1 Tax=Phytohabitans maris TaxID=3071409 RepID=A0ABU0ZRV5_9ACTN|nr:hypothetical protein [Phytohabitans sp. ZYX-F-186]MDQ7909765.1 hypothetical protein [Phytohabitans sp. ZYX-F-186]
MRQASRDGHVPLGEFLADVSRTGVQHQPHPVVRAVLLDADLDEMVAAAEGAHLGVGSSLKLGHAIVEGAELPPERFPAGLLETTDPAWVDGAVALGETNRDRGLDGGTQRAEVIGQLGRGERRADRGHPAADVDADGGRRDGLTHGDHRADSGALAEMDVGHDRDALDPGQAADVA